MNKNKCSMGVGEGDNQIKCDKPATYLTPIDKKYLCSEHRKLVDSLYEKLKFNFCCEEIKYCGGVAGNNILQ